jgi:transcription termination/antitermination protein NusG
VISLGQQRAVRNVVVPTESVSEMKDNQKVTVEKRTMPGYVLVNMELNEDSWGVVKGTPGVTGFVGASQEPVPLTQVEVDRLLHKEVATATRTRAQFTIGESVKVVSGPLSDFSGEISEINDDAAKLKVLVSIFGRETPVEVSFDQVKKIGDARWPASGGVLDRSCAEHTSLTASLPDLTLDRLSGQALQINFRNNPINFQR